MAIIKDMTATNRKALELIFLVFHRWEMHSEHRIKLSLLFLKVWMVPQKCRWLHTAFVERILL